MAAHSIPMKVKFEIVTKAMAGVKVPDIAAEYNVGVSSVYKWVQDHQQYVNKAEIETTKIVGTIPPLTDHLSRSTKLNVINFISSGRSVIEASHRYDIPRDVIRQVVKEYKDGEFELDAPVMVVQTTPVVTETDVDKVCRMIEIMVSNNVAVTDATRIVKQLI
jgi:transposase-like protein